MKLFKHKDITLRNLAYQLPVLQQEAQALWGEQNLTNRSGKDFNIGWREHLKRMVVASDPVKYLGDNL